jgi:hypothetical protein
MDHKDANDLLLAGKLGLIEIVSFEKFAQLINVTEQQLDDFFRRVKKG